MEDEQNVYPYLHPPTFASYHNPYGNALSISASSWEDRIKAALESNPTSTWSMPQPANIQADMSIFESLDLPLIDPGWIIPDSRPYHDEHHFFVPDAAFPLLAQVQPTQEVRPSHPSQNHQEPRDMISSTWKTANQGDYDFDALINPNSHS
jgi:hypothetical protein